MRKVIIDKFECMFVVCEKADRQILDIQKSKIPTTAKGEIFLT